MLVVITPREGLVIHLIPESPLLDSHLGETSVSWFRLAKVRLTDEQKKELSDESRRIRFGVCTQHWNECTWGIVRDKTIADLEREHGKAIHVEINWNGKVEGIQFENNKGLFWLDKTRPFGMDNLPEVVNEDERCKGTFSHGGRCTRYNTCNLHKEANGDI